MSRSIISNGFEYREQHSDGMSDEKGYSRCIRRYNDEDPDDDKLTYVVEVAGPVRLCVSSQDRVSIFFVHFTLTILGHAWNNLCLDGFDKNLYAIFSLTWEKTNFQPTPLELWISSSFSLVWK